MKKALKITLKCILVLVFIYIGTVAICGFNMMQTTSVTLSLTNEDSSITSYTVDFKKSEAYITDYDDSGMHRHEETFSLNTTDSFKTKASLALSFATFWSERYGNDATKWSLSRSRKDETNISSGGASKPFTYDLAQNSILSLFE